MADSIDSARAAAFAPHPGAERPLDARLARVLVRPLSGTAARPNHLTTLRLAVGLAATACVAQQALWIADVGAFLFAFSNFLDHTDGELARLSGAYTRFGHAYDLASDALIHTLLFAAIGWSLRDTELGLAAPAMGLAAGAAVAFIFWLHLRMEASLGKTEAKLPSAGWFEIEDVLYLFPLVTLFHIREAFLVVAFVCAPAFALWLVWFARRQQRVEAG